MSDNEQEVTEHIEHQHDNTPNWNKSAKADGIFASILQTSLSQFTTSLGQLVINQNSKRPAEEG